MKTGPTAVTPSRPGVSIRAFFSRFVASSYGARALASAAGGDRGAGRTRLPPKSASRAVGGKIVAGVRQWRRRSAMGVGCVALLASTPARGDLVFNNGFEGQAAEWAPGSGAWVAVPANAYSPTTSREGARAVGFLPVAGNKRSEFVINNGLGDYHWGTEYWVGFSLRIIRPTLGNGIIHQHHSVPHPRKSCVPGNPKCGLAPVPGDDTPHWIASGAGGNAFTIHLQGGNLEVCTQTDPTKVFATPIGHALWGSVKTSRPFTVGAWYDFVLHFRLATDATGFTQVWMNGELLVDVQGAPTVCLYDSAGIPKSPRHVQKIGIYYGPGKDGGELLYDAFRIWKGTAGCYAAVAPGGEAGPVPAAGANLPGERPAP